MIEGLLSEGSVSIIPSMHAAPTSADQQPAEFLCLITWRARNESVI